MGRRPEPGRRPERPPGRDQPVAGFGFWGGERHLRDRREQCGPGGDAGGGLGREQRGCVLYRRLTGRGAAGHQRGRFAGRIAERGRIQCAADA